MSWLGSDLDSSLFSTNGKQEAAEVAQKNSEAVKVQRFIDFDDQCLSMKSGEGSDFSGIQPLPLGSDDTPPMAQDNFNRVVRMNFENYFVDSEMDSHNRPKPNLSSDSESTDEYLLLPSESSNKEGKRDVGEDERMRSFVGDVDTSSDEFKELLSMLDRQTDPELRNLLGGGDDPMMQKLQLMRIWQLMQQDELKRQQESELALLKAKKMENGLEENLETQQDPDKENIHQNVDDDYESHDSDSSERDIVSFDEEPREERCQENQEEDPNGAENQAIDEVPIAALAKKSFEQRVEEELSKERQKTAELKQQSKGPVKRSFLRKGQGTARFNGPIIRKPLKPRPKEQQKKDISKPQLNAKNSETDINSVQRTANLQRPSQSQRQGNKRVKIPIQKLILKPEPVKSLEASPVKQNPADDKDLKEFEMLEQYAEDDASFFSEPSLVVSLLRHESEMNNFTSECQMTLRERVRERRRAREEARKQVQNNLVLANTAGKEDNAINNLSDYRSSETEFETQKMNFDENLEETLKNEFQEDSEDASENDSPKPPKPYFSSPLVPKAKVIQRKTASLVRKEKLVRPIAHPANCSVFSPIQHSMGGVGHVPGLYTSPNSAFSPHQQPIIVNGAGNVNTNNNAIEVDSHGIEKQDDKFQDEQTWGDIDLSVLDTSSDDITKSDSSGRKYKSSDYMEPEREDIENPVRDIDTAKMGMDLKNLSLSPPPPPTVLMQKLFPGLKLPNSSRRSTEKEQQVATSPVDEKSIQETSETNSEGDVVQTSLLKQKLQELEKEISRFKKENATLGSLKRQHEEALTHFAKEMEEFKKQKEDELKRLEEYRKTEMKKLKKEKKLFEDHVQATKLYPRKEEREQIQKLTEEVESLKVDNKMKEQRWISANGRMRSQIEKLENDNSELSDRLQEMIEQRAREWNKKKKSVNLKPQSKWKAVNDMVEHEIIHSPKSDSAVVMDGQTYEHARKAGKMKNPKSDKKLKNTGDVERPRPCIKQTKTSHIHDWNVMKASATASDSGLSETVHKDGKIERSLKDGSRVVEFPNGTQKEVSADGKTVTVNLHTFCLLALCSHKSKLI